MADLFKAQAKKYAEARPTYPPELFRYIASKCPRRSLAWDAGTGSGQAAVALAGLFDQVIATDASPEQLAFATRLPNIHYRYTPSAMTTVELEGAVAPPGSVDVVTVATALHWFDLPSFYSHVKHVLRPGGVFAAWCYYETTVDEGVDRLLKRFGEVLAAPYCDQRAVRLVFEDQYRSIEFPFDPVEGEEHTGPMEFEAVRKMDCDTYLTFIRSSSPYQTAKGRGVELLTEEVVGEFRRAWSNGDEVVKKVRFPIHLRIGRVNG